ncbi:MAG: HAD family hydrolase [Coraliomargarita sp.]
MNKDHWLTLIHNRRQTGTVELPEDAARRLVPLDGIRAVVFDIYGTLFSSGVGDISLATEQNRDSALKAVLRDNGIQLSAKGEECRIDNALHAVIHSHQDRRRDDGIEYPEVEIRAVWVDFIQQLLTDGLLEPEFEADIETLVIDYESRVNPTQAMPGLQTTLDKLRAQGRVLSIISNAQFCTPLLFETYLQHDLKELGFSLDCAVWSYEQLEGKPSKRLYEVSAALLKAHHGIEPGEVLYVGNDMRNDIWPAQLVGYKTALFAGDRLSLRRRPDDPRCKDVVADLEITALDQVFECI